MQIGTTQFPRTPQTNYNSRQIIHFTHQEASSHSILHMVQVLHNILRAQKSKQNYSNCGLKICLVHWMLQWPPGPGTKMWLPQTNADGTNLLLQSKMWLVTWKANAQLMHSKQKTNLDIYFSNSVALKMGSGHHTWYEKVKSNTGSSFSLSQFQIPLLSSSKCPNQSLLRSLLADKWLTAHWRDAICQKLLAFRWSKLIWHLNDKRFYPNEMDSKEEAERITQTLHFPPSIFFFLQALDTKTT